MRRGEMQAHQERLLRSGVALNGLHRPIAEQVRHVAVPLDRHLLFVKLARLRAGAQRIRTMIEIVGSAAEDAEEVIVAALQWTEIRKVTEMPFADQRGAVARLLQQRRQRRMVRGQADILRSRRIDRLFKACPVRIQEYARVRARESKVSP
jgi:hypothetical protein